MSGTITRSGGFEGSSEVLPLEGGSGTIIYSYEMFGIPDAFRIRFDSGVGVSTGFVSGPGSGSIEIPRGASAVYVDLATNDQGTAWNYTVTIDERDCEILQEDLARARNSYDEAVARYRQLPVVDLEGQQIRIEGLEQQLLLQDAIITLTIAKEFGGLFNDIAKNFLPKPAKVAFEKWEKFTDAVDATELAFEIAEQDPKNTVDNIIDTAQFSANLGAEWFWQDKIFDGIKRELDAVNLATDIVQAQNALDEVLDDRLAITEALADARQRLVDAERTQALKSRLYPDLLEKYELANSLYRQFNDECAPTDAGDPNQVLLTPPGGTAPASVGQVPVRSGGPVALASVAAAASAPASADEPEADTDEVVAQGPSSQGVLEYDDATLGGRVALGTADANEIVLAAGNDAVYAGAGADTVTTAEGNDLVFGHSGDDDIDVGAGDSDLVGFAGIRSEYVVTTNTDGSVTVQDSVAGRDGSDVVRNAEGLFFRDGSVNLADPDRAPFLVVSDAEVVEGQGDLVFDLGLTRPITSNVTGDYILVRIAADGTETEVTRGSISIAPGEGGTQLSFEVPDDTAAEPNETYGLHIRNLQGASLAGVSVPGLITAGIGEVIDDDGPLPDLVVTRSGDAPTPGATSATYVLTVTNDGQGLARDVELSEVLPLGVQVVSATASTGTAQVTRYGDIRGLLGDLAAGETATVSVDVRIPAAGNYVGTARVSTVSYEEDLSNNASLTATVVSLAPLGEADLSLGLTASTAAAAVGDTVTLAVTVRNAGPEFASDIDVSLPLPAELQFVSASTVQGTFDAATGIWSVGNLRDGLERTLTITATATADSDLELVAEVVKVAEGDPDSTPGNAAAGEDDYATVSLTVGAGDGGNGGGDGQGDVDWAALSDRVNAYFARTGDWGIIDNWLGSTPPDGGPAIGGGDGGGNNGGGAPGSGNGGEVDWMALADRVNTYFAQTGQWGTLDEWLGSNPPDSGVWVV